MKLRRTGMAICLAIAPLLLVAISGTQAVRGAQAGDQHPLIDMLVKNIN